MITLTKKECSYLELSRTTLVDGTVVITGLRSNIGFYADSGSAKYYSHDGSIKYTDYFGEPLIEWCKEVNRMKKYKKEKQISNRNWVLKKIRKFLEWIKIN